MKKTTSAKPTEANTHLAIDHRWRLTADAMPALLAYIGSDCRYQMANARYRDWFGVDPAQLPGRHIREVVGEAAWAKIVLYVDRVLAGETVHYQAELAYAGAAPRWMDVNYTPDRTATGGLAGFAVLAADITQRKHAEERLIASEVRFRSVLNNSTDVIYRVHLPTNRFEYISPAVTTVTGYTPAELFEMDFAAGQALVHPEDRATLRLAQALLERAGKASVDYRQRTQAGDYRWLSNNMTLIRDHAGQPLYRDGTIRDITARKQVEQQIKAALAEKEVLLREVHHRVKNNLQVIASLVSLQADGVTDARVLAEFAEVRDRVRAMALVHEALYQTPDLARLDFADYAARLMQQLWQAHRAPAGTVQLKLAVAPVTLPIDAAVSCGLILNELASNTLKHAFPAGRSGQVTVGLEHEPATGAACLWVQDNGVGLPAGVDWRQSQSLGLRLVQMLASQLRGTVATGPGPGTEFRVNFTLP